jgi:hypothetical protein
MVCNVCGWKFVAGGFDTLKDRDKAEREERKIHDETHEPIKIKTARAITTTTTVKPSYTITRSTHAAELPHASVEQPNRQTANTTTYTAVSGCSISSGSLVTGQNYLIIVTGILDAGGSSTANNNLRLVHGTTVFDGSESTVETSDSHTYMYWVYHQQVSGEDISLQMRSSSTATVGVDSVTITAFKLTPDLTLNTHFAHNAITTTTSLTQDVDTTINNASVTITPDTASHKWLILSKAHFGTGISTSNAMQSRIKRSGEATNNSVVIQQEGEDGSLDKFSLCGVRVDTLGAVSNTYEEVSTCKNSGSAASGTRDHSGIFMLDLDVFDTYIANHEDSPQEAPNSSTTAYAELIHTATIPSRSVAGDTFTLGYITTSWGGTDFDGRFRLQIDDTDQPTGQTTDSYTYNQWDAADKLAECLTTVDTHATTASHVIDLDGSLVSTGQTNPGSYTRTIVSLTFELDAAAGITQLKPETEAITENVVVTLGFSLKTVKNETEAITETVIPIVTSTANIIQDENIVFRMSGGTTNTTLANSIGGARSTQAGGVLTNKLFDDVSISEASTGDTEYRCFYILNAHASLQASSVKVWIPTNTPAQDEIDIGLGSSAVNGTEQGPLADESTPPTSVTFVVANSEATAINCENLPAGQHRAIWLRRIVPASAAFFPNNTYQLQVSLYSDHG